MTFLVHVIILHIISCCKKLCFTSNCKKEAWFRFMVFNATFNNISVISWRSVLLVEETGIPGENHRPVARNWQTLSHLTMNGVQTHNFVVIGTDFTGSCKSNYHTIANTMAHAKSRKWEFSNVFFTLFIYKNKLKDWSLSSNIKTWANLHSYCTVHCIY